MKHILSNEEALALKISVREVSDALYPLLTLEKNDLIALLPKRFDRSNKGSYGRVLAVAGSRGMAGAAYLAAKAAYRSGAGLVEIFTHDSNRTALQTLLPEAIMTVYERVEDIPALLTASLSKADSVLVGCGLSTDTTAAEIVKLVLKNTKAPTVIDADALNIISMNDSLRALIPKSAILTPHAAEASRLTGLSIGEILDAAVDTAVLISRELDCVCLLKDHRSIIASQNTVYANMSGNNGMSTAGSGDVLAGIIASIAAQNKRAGEIFGTSLQSADVAALGAFIHGCAGDAARDSLGERSLMAGDIIDFLPHILKEYNYDTQYEASQKTV